MKKASTILLILCVTTLTVYNIIFAKIDPFSTVGGIIVVILVTIIWIYSSVMSGGSQITILVCIALIVGSGGSAITKLIETPTPLVSVDLEVDNSTDLYPMPEDPNPAQEETMEWINGKWVIGAGEGAQKVGLAGIGAGFVSFLLMLLSGWIFSLSFMPEKIKGSG